MKRYEQRPPPWFDTATPIFWLLLTTFFVKTLAGVAAFIVWLSPIIEAKIQTHRERLEQEQKTDQLALLLLSDLGPSYERHGYATQTRFPGCGVYLTYDGEKKEWSCFGRTHSALVKKHFR